MFDLNDVAAGEVLDHDDMPVRCDYRTSMSGHPVQCERIVGHDGPHRVTASYLAGGAL